MYPMTTTKTETLVFASCPSRNVFVFATESRALLTRAAFDAVRAGDVVVAPSPICTPIGAHITQGSHLIAEAGWSEGMVNIPLYHPETLARVWATVGL